MKVLGIDPGTAVLGFGVVDAGPAGARLVECGVLSTKAGHSLPCRLRLIHDGVRELIARHRPDAMAVESVFYARNVRTTMVMSHARGVILLAAEEAGLALAEYTPAMVKKTVGGRGAALTPLVGYMGAHRRRRPRARPPPHAADGVALARPHVRRTRRVAGAAAR